MITHDPRPQWDGKEAELDRIEKDLESYVQIAKAIHDPPTIALVSNRLEDFKKTRAAYREVRTQLDDAMAAHKAADAECTAAKRIEQAGSIVAAQALKNHERFIIADAKTRALYWPLASLFAGCTGTRERLSVCASSSTDREVVEETVDFARKLFEYSSPKGVYADAEEAGRRSNADRAAWWLLAEEIARREFAKRLETATRDRKKQVGTVGDFLNPYVAKREYPDLPTAKDLEECFARRRAGFAAEKRRVHAQMQALGGHLETLGGAS